MYEKIDINNNHELSWLGRVVVDHLYLHINIETIDDSIERFSIVWNSLAA